MATALDIPRVGVGVILTRNTGQEVLVGRRKGGLEPDVWALPGGHLEHGETFEQCAERELLEETGLNMEHTHFVWACNTIFNSSHHYVTIFVQEPEKCHEWRWVQFSDIPHPLFSPLRALLESGFEPSADKLSMNVRLSEVIVSESARSGHKTTFERKSSSKENDGWDTPAMEIAAAVQPMGHGTAGYVGHTVERGADESADDHSHGGVVLMGPTVVPVRTTFPHQQ